MDVGSYNQEELDFFLTGEFFFILCFNEEIIKERVDLPFLYEDF